MILTLHVRSGQEQHWPCNFLLPFTSILKSVKLVILQTVRGFHILTSSNMCLRIEFTHTLRINANFCSAKILCFYIIRCDTNAYSYHKSYINIEPFKIKFNSFYMCLFSILNVIYNFS